MNCDEYRALQKSVFRQEQSLRIMLSYASKTILEREMVINLDRLAILEEVRIVRESMQKLSCVIGMRLPDQVVKSHRRASNWAVLEETWRRTLRHDFRSENFKDINRERIREVSEAIYLC